MKLRDWIELIRIEIAREEGRTGAMAEYGVVLAVITVGVVAADWSARRRNRRESSGSRHQGPDRLGIAAEERPASRREYRNVLVSTALVPPEIR